MRRRTLVEWRRGEGSALFFWKREEIEEERVVGLQSKGGKRFKSNVVVTSKYTIVTFLFRNLYEQFHKYSNLYFIGISILQICPAITTTNQVPTFLWPLCFVLLVNACKDAYEDWRRHRADDIENNSVTHVIPTGWEFTDERRALGFPRVSFSEESILLEDAEFGDFLNGENEGSQGVDPSHGAYSRIVTADEDGNVISEGKRNSFACLDIDSNVLDEDFVEETYGSEGEQTERIDPLVQIGVWSKAWKQVRVGDIVLCGNRDVFPADMILLCTSDQHGLAFVETSSLDGETNLKVKQAQQDIYRKFDHTDPLKNLEIVSHMDGYIQCSPPDKDLNSFSGTLNISDAQGGRDAGMKPLVASLGTSQLLLRGCKLRNTDWAIALCVYTGHESKIMMNSVSAPRKMSRVEILTNRLTFFIWFVQIMICMVGGIMSSYYASSTDYQSRSYLTIEKRSDKYVIGFVSFCTWIVLSANFVPISLIVTMGMVKAMQAYFIMIDKDMYHAETNTYACPRTSDLNEELGQVGFIFSDKTGTLTCNVMEFRKCCIHGFKYGMGITDVKRQVMKRLALPISEELLNLENAHKLKGTKKTSNVNCCDPLLDECLSTPTHPNHAHVIEFFLHLAINHSVVTEYDNESVRYSASSPDEGALVYAAKHFGIEFLGREPGFLNIAVLGSVIKVQVLAEIEFTSARQRSSLLCKLPDRVAPDRAKETLGNGEVGTEESAVKGDSDKDDNKSVKTLNKICSGRIVLFCKGADNVIMNLLKCHDDRQLTMFEEMEEYAQDALRTLCIAKREIDKTEFIDWFAKYKAATLMTEGREKKIHELASEIEKDLVLQGITGIEDTLQEGVFDTIESLRMAGIKIWMLTGDKVETAVNIGIATGLITGSHKLTYVWDSLQSVHALKDKINDDIEQWEATKECIKKNGCVNIAPHVTNENHEQKNEHHTGNQGRDTEGTFNTAEPCLAVVLDGETLTHLLTEEMIGEFTKLIKECKSVICSRVTPHQKGAIVALVKKVQKRITLAIGDGANDCNMIQTADVGIGLRGQEGLQAFNNSDYGLSQFRFLKPLLLIHGRYCYRRITTLVLYMFYKNIVLVIPIFGFAFVSLFSGQKIYFEFMYQLYNVVFTAIPVMVYGVLDQDVNKEDCLKYPMLYRLGHVDYYFNNKKFIAWILNGLWHGAVSFLVPLFGLAYLTIANSEGAVLDRWMVGNVVFCILSIIVNFKILLETTSLSYIPFLGVFFSLAGLFLFSIAFSNMPTVAGPVLGNMMICAQSPVYYLVTFATIVIALSRDYVWKVLKRAYRPELYHLLQEREIIKIPVKLLDEVDAKKQEREGDQAPDRESVSRKSVPVTKLPSIAPAETLARRKTSRGYAFSEADTRAVKLVWVDSDRPS